MSNYRIKKANKKRQRKKNKKKPGLFIGHPGSIGMSFWPGMIERYQAKLDSGIIRHSKRKEKLIRKIKKLQYLVWEYKGWRKVMYETMRRTAHLSDTEKLKQVARVNRQVHTEMWQAYRREHLCK